MSQSSKIALDPLTDVLDVLGASVTRRTRIEAGGRWALKFPAIDRLKFVAVLRGSQWMLIPGQEPQLLNEGDVCLLGRTAYAVASHPDVAPIDGLALYEGCNTARIGGCETVALGGTVTFAGAGADFLLQMLPEFMIVPRSTSSSGAIATILSLINEETERDTMGGGIVSARLADVLLVEAFRTYAADVRHNRMGWLGALLDPRLGRVLRAIHDDVAQPWTVVQLAGVAGMSRAAFSAEFTRRTGQPPLTYLRTWRLTIARSALARGDTTVAGISVKVGYGSQSAFAHAFRQAFGLSPKADTKLSAMEPVSG